MSDVMYRPSKKDGWIPVYKEYPPFYKKVCVYIAELDKNFIGEIIMISNKVCIPKPIHGYLDLDNYWGVYWRLEPDKHLER